MADEAVAQGRLMPVLAPWCPPPVEVFALYPGSRKLAGAQGTGVRGSRAGEASASRIGPLAFTLRLESDRRRQPRCPALRFGLATIRERQDTA